MYGLEWQTAYAVTRALFWEFISWVLKQLLKWEINTETTLDWAQKTFIGTVQTSFYFLYNMMSQ